MGIVVLAPITAVLALRSPKSQEPQHEIDEEGANG
jgi:hypothetical protein